MKLIIIALVILLVSAPARAQNCGNGLPCGQLPWSLPGYPNLVSPSPIPTINITATPSPTTPSGTLTPTPTPTELVPMDELEDQIATIRAILDSTAMPIDDGSVPQAVGEQAEVFFSYAKGLSEMNLGVVSPMLAFIIFSFMTVLTVKITVLLLPIFTAIFGLIRKAVQIVLDFLPL